MTDWGSYFAPSAGAAALGSTTARVPTTTPTFVVSAPWVGAAAIQQQAGVSQLISMGAIQQIAPSVPYVPSIVSVQAVGGVPTAQPSVERLAAPAPPKVVSVAQVVQPTTKQLVSVAALQAVGAIQAVAPTTEFIPSIKEFKVIEPTLTAQPAVKQLASVAELRAIGAVPSIQPTIEYLPSAAPTLAQLFAKPVTTEGIMPPGMQRLHIMALGADLSGFPETDEEKRLKWRQTLDEVNPVGVGNGDNDLIAKYFWVLIPGITQKQQDPREIANLVRWSEAVVSGDMGTLYKMPWASADYIEQYEKTIPFNTLSLADQEQRITELAKCLYESKLPYGYATVLIQDVMSKAGSPDRTQALFDYATKGELDRAIKSDTVYGLKTGIKEFVTTPGGQMSIGAVIAGVAVGGAILTGGASSAMMAVGTSIFSVTELPNYFGMDPFRAKSTLQSTGQFASDRAFQYDQNYKAAESSVYNIKSTVSTTDPKVNLANLQKARDTLSALKDQLGNNSAYLAANGIYDDEVRRYKDLAGSFDSQLSMFDAQGNYIQKTLPPVTLYLKNVPPGVTTRYGPNQKGAYGDFMIASTDKDMEDQLIFTKDGIDYNYGIVKLPLIGGDKTIGGIGDWIEKQKQYQPKLKVTPTLPVTLSLEPNQTAYIEGKAYTLGPAGGLMGLEYPSGAQLSIKFSTPGMKDDTGTYLIINEVTNRIARYQEPEYKAPVSATQGYAQFTLEAGQSITIDGFKPPVAVDPHGMMLTPGYHNIKIEEPGREAYEKTVYISAGETTAIAGKGYPIRAEYPSGGGGGGEPSGGAAAPAQPLISFGQTFVGARIWLDDVEIFPVLGQAYSTTSGYHAVKATKPGYKDFSKTVYCMEGQTLNVDAAFEPGVGTGGEAAPGTVPGVEVKSYIQFGDPILNATVWLDDALLSVVPGAKVEVAYGYHGIKISKAGKEDWIKNVYIAKGDILTVSPIFTDLPSTTPTTPTTPTGTTRRVYINTTPSGSKIIIDGGFVGEWTPAYVDLERGLYKLTTTKSGYVDRNSWIWVGDVIAFGDTALALARIAGVIS